MSVKSFYTTVFLLLSAVPAFCGELNRYEAKVENFTELSIRDNINIVYESLCFEDSAGMAKAVFYTTPDIAPLIVFSSKNDKLTVEFANKATKPANPPTVTVYSKFLTLVENESDSTIHLARVNPVPHIKLRVMGNGKLVADSLNANSVSASITTGCGIIAVSGICNQANLTNMSAGTIQADKLIANDVKSKLIGTGSIGCTPLNSLSLAGAGTGKLYYFGTPKKIDNKALNIKLIPMEGE